MTPDELRQAAEVSLQQMYRAQTRGTPGGEVVDDSGLLLYLHPDRSPVDFNGAMVVDPALDPEDAVARALAHFGARGRGFTLWAVGEEPGPLDAAALDAGLTLQADRSIIYHVRPPKPPPGPASEYQQLVDRVRRILQEPVADLGDGIIVRRIVDEASLAAFRSVTASCFGPSGTRRSAIDATFARVASVHGPGVGGIIVELDGEPAAAALSYVAQRVATLNWIGTVADARGRGVGAACTLAAAVVGFGLGADAVSGPATDSGERLYARLGGEVFTRHRWYVQAEAHR